MGRDRIPPLYSLLDYAQAADRPYLTGTCIMSFNKKSVVSALVALPLLVNIALPVQAEDHKDASVSDIVVKAKPEAVYHAIIKLREETKDQVKEVSHDGHSCVLEETFEGLPIIGQAKCTYKETYAPYKKIEYSLVNSEKFRAFEGKWTLSPCEDGESTHLSLSSYVDVELPVPFAKSLTKMQTMRGVKRRLKMVKTACEAPAVSMKKQAIQ